MFTGLVETQGEIAKLTSEGPGVRLTVLSALVAEGLTLGASIAVNGCCLTVVAFENDHFEFEAGSETLSRTNLGRLRVGSLVNLERSLRVGDRLGGHFVTGHIDALGRLMERREEGPWSFLTFELPGEFAKFVVDKGSIAVDGVSLTVVQADRDRFSVALIPHTLAVTTLGALAIGDAVNLETDLLAKYAVRQFADWPASE